MEIDKSLIAELKKAKSIVFFTGAGISAESSIPTFRGKDGIWNKLKPEELANFDAFMKNPEMVWEWYNHRKKIIQESQPNRAHTTIAEIQNYFDEIIVVTQNIDNLHRRAGSKKIFELHGNIERNYCINCKEFYIENLDFSAGVPKCKCGGLIRPDVVWFGEYLPMDQFNGGEKAAANCDIFFAVGTSAVVYPAAGLINVAHTAGATIVEVNIEETALSHIANYTYTRKAGEILPQIFNDYSGSAGLN
ncbi:MAG: NAD-dependent deacylase [Ignavibacteria bacterium]|nr:NAD-dependent deacylase [Ignavibacteria bacterium]MBT8381293.1 NAD-dependent deacylase [Ignavibacteria bacterium]NNL20143.1 NAD-dependent deacylase [Ignavibacteriaceae bacterium]